MSDSPRWAASDVIAFDRQAAVLPEIEAAIGTLLTHRATNITGEVVAFSPGARLVLRDPAGRRHEFTPGDGQFSHDGRAVALRRPQPQAPHARRVTASGSFDSGLQRAQVAQASRIWVEGFHDAELIEKIWGDDLRAEGIVVEPLHGADDLPARVDGFGPSPDRRLGVLLDHLVEGTKEWRIAAEVDSRHVLITGHPYVDIWQAIKPEVIGIEAWPSVARPTPWKEGVVAALGFEETSGRFWGEVLRSVSSYLDVETPLITAVEQLIDFVANPAD
ncbi:MAG: DUF3097 family protein [Acidimicrobiia bacterium]|nr:DUF3097 domain-containing protein [Acidimicrobiia bacterium]NNF09559.1 DUF3097 family protein [Acidimicrobiia bacterium]NNL71497.1 DUF3097 family protein [Acidimicrobiia bacterium]